MNFGSLVRLKRLMRSVLVQSNTVGNASVSCLSGVAFKVIDTIEVSSVSKWLLSRAAESVLNYQHSRTDAVMADP